MGLLIPTSSSSEENATSKIFWYKSKKETMEGSWNHFVIRQQHVYLDI